MNKLKVNTIDFEALIKDLPIVNPLPIVYETSHIFEIHKRMIQDYCEEYVKSEE